MNALSQSGRHVAPPVSAAVSASAPPGPANPVGTPANLAPAGVLS